MVDGASVAATRDAADSPSSVQELSNWRDRLADAGVRLTNEQQVDWVRWEPADLMASQLLAPMRPLHDLMGVGQGGLAVPVTPAS